MKLKRRLAGAVPRRWLAVLLLLSLGLFVGTYLWTLLWPTYRPGVVISCFPSSHIDREPSTLPLVMNLFLGMRFVSNSEYTDNPLPWDVWATCSTSSVDRIPAAMAMASGEMAVVNFLPGKCPLAAKAGLWQGLEARFGRYEAAKIAPMTIVRPSLHEDVLREFLDTLHANTTFVTKSGHRQRGIQEVEFNVHNKSDFMQRIMQIQPVVMQQKQESFRYGNRRTAFRTYTWIQCKQNNRASATIDWNSPAYVAVGETALVASGYTASQEAFSAHQLLTKLGIARQVKQQVQRKVGKVLVAFGVGMCQGYQPGARTEELFALDWVPTLDGLDAMLLEVNRFPDVRLSAKLPSQFTAKDWLKVCTHLRRFPAWLVLPDQLHHYHYCQSNREESLAEMV